MFPIIVWAHISGWPHPNFAQPLVGLVLKAAWFRLDMAGISVGMDVRIARG